MATIGQQLVQPEEGWKRYDDTHSAIKYSGTWVKQNHANYYGNSITLNQTGNLGNKIKFDFIGSKVRLIGSLTPYFSDNIEIKINNSFYSFSVKTTAGSSQLNQALICEVDLNFGTHKVEIEQKSSGSGSAYDFYFDAIDIDSTGRLLHPDEVTDIKDLDIGKRIRCHYQTSTANTVGTFSNLGQETSDFIPVASSNIPNGDFYWIVVADENKKKKLIADRNIQSSISWDTLNSAGIASGSGLPINLNLSGRYFSIIRLLTGGINNTDKDNEWDQHIVNSTLNGSIVAGDNNVWNWSGLGSWTSTTVTTSAGNRVNRSGSIYGNTSSSTTNSSYGFRPVLIIEDKLKTHTFIKSNNQYKTFKNNQWNNVSTSLPSESIFISDGMQNLSVLDRKETKFIQNISDNGVLGEGKVFKSTIDLKKLFEIKSIEIE